MSFPPDDDLDLDHSGLDGSGNEPTCRSVSPSGTFGPKDHFSPPLPPRLEFTLEEGSDSGAEGDTEMNSLHSFLPPMDHNHDSDDDGMQAISFSRVRVASVAEMEHRLPSDFYASQESINESSTKATPDMHLLDEFGSPPTSPPEPNEPPKKGTNMLAAPGATQESAVCSWSSSPGKARKKRSFVTLTKEQEQPGSPRVKGFPKGFLSETDTRY